MTFGARVHLRPCPQVTERDEALLVGVVWLTPSLTLTLTLGVGRDRGYGPRQAGTAARSKCGQPPLFASLVS